MDWIFYTLFVKFLVETFVFNIAHFYESSVTPSMSLIFRQRLLRFTSGLLILNKFIDIKTLIKRNLNFKCEVKSYKTHLQAYCNNKMLSILFENKADAEYYTDS